MQEWLYRPRDDDLRFVQDYDLIYIFAWLIGLTGGECFVSEIWLAVWNSSRYSYVEYCFVRNVLFI